MGFYLRKTVKVGGINLNLSSGGLGISTGVKGFRVGMNGRSTYVQMGRGGLYYRKQISWRRQASGQRSAVGSTHADTVRFQDQSIIFTENLAQPLAFGLADAETEKVLAHFKPPIGYVWALIAVPLALILCTKSPAAGIVALALISAGCVLQGLKAERRVLVYDLDDQALQRFERFVNNFGEFFQANRLWMYESRAVTTDWKRNAGATNLMKRRAAEVLPSGDPKIKTNLSIPCLRSGADSLYFLPDMIVCKQGSTLRSFKYDALQFAAAQEVFIEEDSVPSDANVIGHTWRFVRKDGGPDRRFNNNRQLPKCLYQSLRFRLNQEFERTFSKSRVLEPAALNNSFASMAEVLLALKFVDNLAALPALKTEP
jgi:hypothetical protein